MQAMTTLSIEPSEQNNYLDAHAQRIIASYHHWTKRHLIAPQLSPLEQARTLFNAPFVVLSHNTDADPLLNYGNRAGLELFEIRWEELLVLPSRLTAESPQRDERARLLTLVTRDGFIDDYSGIRISKNGRRFMIERATVWNLLDEQNQPYGQAATFSRWRFVD
jgi:hypothetical protein